MDDTRRVRILGISGSVRRLSTNRAVIAAATQLAPSGAEVTTFDGLLPIPAFNPDVRDSEITPAVHALRCAIDLCDAVIISSPEYAHGVPGALKNALDWLVGSGEFIDKPVAVINASSRASYAWASLVETLRTMSATIVEEASITLPLDGRAADASVILADASLARTLADALETLAAAARKCSRQT
jgi:NAD(P)H-dependent FMN reductase